MESVRMVKIDLQSGKLSLSEIHLLWVLFLALWTDSEKVTYPFAIVSTGNGECDDGTALDLINVDSGVGSTGDSQQLRMVQVEVDRTASIDQIRKGLMDQFSEWNGHEQYEVILSASKDDQTSTILTKLLTNKSQSTQDARQYSLALRCIRLAGDARVVLLYDAEYVSTKKAKRLAAQLSHLVLEVCNAPPNTKCANLQFVSHEDLCDIWKWNATLPKTLEACAHDLFSTQALQHPEAPAICAWDGELTFHELDYLSNRLAKHLSSQLDVGPETKVVVCFEKSAWTVVAMLSVMKAGGAFVPIDPQDPVERQKALLLQTESRVILASSLCFESISQSWPSSCSMMAIDRDSLSRLPSADNWSSPCHSPTMAAYVLFTSGSTGKPKGVLVEHQALCTSAHAHGPVLGITSISRVLQFAAYTFDSSILEMFTTLMLGGCVCVPSDADRIERLPSVVGDLGVNLAVLTPSVVKTMKPQDLAGIETLLLGGEAVSSEVRRTWAMEPPRVLRIGYGPTECCILSVGSDCAKVEGGMHHAIGYPVGSVGWIVDPHDHNKLAPIGAIGELLTEGPILARGYLNDPEKTDYVFIQAPAWLRSGQGDYKGRQGRLYKTGDLVWYNEDGSINYLGRKGGQLKVNGYRIEPGEVEAHLRALLSSELAVIVDAVSLVANGPSSLAVFVQVRDRKDSDIILTDEKAVQEAHVTFEGVCDELRTRVPKYMVPNMCIPISRVPLTSSGKTDRAELRRLCSSLSSRRALQLQTPANSSEHRQPSTETEQILRELAARALRREEAHLISIDDNLFRIGGDSLTAMTLSGLARDRGLNLSVKDIFQHSTIGQMALLPSLLTLEKEAEMTIVTPFTLVESCGSELTKTALAERIGVAQNGIIDAYPTTYLQSQFILPALSRGRPAANYWGVDIEGSCNIERLESVCRDLVTACDILRTVFLLHDGTLFQIVLHEIPIEISHQSEQDLTNGSEINEDYLCQEDANTTADVSKPLTKFFIVKKSRSKGYSLILRMSHAQYDGISLNLLYEALRKAYYEHYLPTVVPFATYIYHTRRQNAKSFQYWRNLLKGSSMTPVLPTQDASLGDTVVVSTTVDAPAMIGNMTAASILSAAWAATLSETLHISDVVYGQVVTGRNSTLRNIQDVAGPCVNWIPIRIKTDNSTPPTELVARVQEQTLVGEEGSVGLHEILEHCVDWPRNTRFTSVVQYQNAAVSPERVKATNDIFGSPRSIYISTTLACDLFLLFVPHAEKHVVHLFTQMAAFKQDVVQKILDDLVVEIKRAVSGLRTG